MFNKIIAFIKTKIGTSLLLALIFVVGAGLLKLSQNNLAHQSGLQNKIGLIANESVKNGIKNGDLVPSDWENSLKLITNSGDQGVTNLFGTNSESSTKREELTATDRFSREFFTQYLNLKKSGAAIDENTGMNLIDQLLAQDYGSPTEQKIYTDKDISVTSDISKESLRRYGNNLGSIINTPLPKEYEQELTIVTRVNDTGNTDDLAKLSLNITRYETIRNKIVGLTVPVTLKNAHLALINSLGAMLDGVKGMTLIETDPVGATKMITGYEDGLKSLPLSLEIIKTYFSEQNIVFSPTESGYVITR